MKKQTKSNLPIALQTLGIIFLIFFVMAFACKDDNDGSSETDSTRPTDIPQTSENGGPCSTKAEFLQIFERDRLKSATTRDDDRQSEIIVDSFNVGASIKYSPVYNSKVVDIYPAYPVTVDWTQRTFRFNRTTESDYERGLFYCYKNPEDYASKFPPEDDRFSKDACVCIAQNPEAVSPVKPERECLYDGNEPKETCSGN